MATLKPFRDYDEKDVINLYSFNLLTGKNDDTEWTLGTDWSGKISAGHIVSIAVGWSGQDLVMGADAGAGSEGLKNVTTQRYGVAAKIESAGGALVPLGMTLHHVAKYDENGEQLKFNPRKASELEAVIDGQAVPVVTRGLFLIGGLEVGVQALDAAYLAAGAKLYAHANGGITTDSTSNVLIGKALGLADSNDNVLIKLEL
jgi:hypothetical protein